MPSFLFFIVALATGLFVYTFFLSDGDQLPLDRDHVRTAASRIPPSAAPAATPAAAATTPSEKYVAFFQKQAHERREIFNKGLEKKWGASVADVLLPIVEEAHCPLLVRVGSVGDGGKWVCNPWAMPKDGVVFSLGSYNDISFEAEYQLITNGAAKILTVDMINAKEKTLEGLAGINADFVHAMIASETHRNASPPHYTVQDIMEDKGYKSIEILKMDIEGAEHTVMPQFLKGNSVCQIMIEIHGIGKTAKLLREIANAGFLLQRYELNAFWTGVGLCEYSFIHENCLEKYGAIKLASYLKE